MIVKIIIVLIIIIINNVKSQLSIINTSPEYLINTNDDLIINTIGAPEDSNDLKIYILSGFSVWEEISFQMVNSNQFKIDKSNISNKYWGERLLRLYIPTLNIYSDNYSTIGIATPILDEVSRGPSNLYATCYYLNNTNYKTYLKGISLNPVEPIAYLPPINNDPIYKFRLEYSTDEIQLIRSYPYLQCEDSKSNSYQQPALLPFPDISSLSWDKIERKGGLFNYYGVNLYPFDENNDLAYKLYFYYSNDSSLNPSIECKNYTVIKYNGDQIYNISCIIDSYYEPAPNAITIITESPVGQVTYNYRDLYLPPEIKSTTSSFYGISKDITIKGSSFCIYPNVTIGGGKCELIESDYKNDILYCNFKSDIQDLTDTLTVSVECFNQVATADIFIYSIDECELSRNCSGNGICNNETRMCLCNSSYSNYDCSIKVNPNNTLLPPKPIINSSKTIIETQNSKFDIGISQIREIDINNNIIKVYNLTSSIWKLEQETNNNNNQIFITTLPNQSIIKANLFINLNNSTDSIYDFYGDNIKLLNNSVKYQVEITNWNFNSSLNILQLIFQSQISAKECNEDNIIENGGETNIQYYGDTIRSIELTLVNGQTLIGTFSNRMKNDNKIIKSDTKVLSTAESIGIPSISPNNNINTQNVFIAISIPSFKEIVIIDPNFGLLLSNDISTNNNNKCNNNNKLESWKISLIVVLPCIAIVAVIITIGIVKYKNSFIKVNKIKLNKM